MVKRTTIFVLLAIPITDREKNSSDHAKLKQVLLSKTMFSQDTGAKSKELRSQKIGGREERAWGSFRVSFGSGREPKQLKIEFAESLVPTSIHPRH
jgi:hypothetical protein